MLFNESAKNVTELLSNIDSVYISEKFFEMVNRQSCDCDEIVIKNGDKYILLTSHPSGEDGYIEINEAPVFEQTRFPFEVDMDKECFKLDKLSFVDNGAIDGIRLRADGVFLFIFALEHNLVLTKSKCDLFQVNETDLSANEAELIICTTNWYSPYRLSCRQCGEKLDLSEFGPNKICPHCGKETAPVNIKEVHVNFSDTIYGEPNELSRETNARFVEGVDYLEVCLQLELSVGNISSPPHSNSFVYTHRYSSYKIRKKFVEKNIKKLSQADESAIVYLWINERDVNAYLNLLKFSSFFKRFEEVYLIRCCSEEDMQKDEYEPNDSFANKTRITRDELDAMTVKYLDIVKLGGEYRIGCYGDVHICTEEYMERFVMDQITDEYLNFNSIYIKVHDAFEEATGYIIEYDVVEELVWRLMTKRRIQSHGACEWWGDSSYNNMLCTQSFCLSSPKTVSYTCDDALEIVYDAFEWGYTYPLYDIIADDAILKFEDGKEVFRGKCKIIGFIENDGSHRVNVSKAKVTCAITHVKEGERYGVGEKCIVLHYKYSNRDRLFIVRVHFENNKIQKIQMFDPIGPLELV